MGTISLLGLGTLAGLHGALYGAYKDSPHESFLFRRFLREVLQGTARRTKTIVNAMAFPRVQRSRE